MNESTAPNIQTGEVVIPKQRKVNPKSIANLSLAKARGGPGPRVDDVAESSTDSLVDELKAIQGSITDEKTLSLINKIIQGGEHSLEDRKPDSKFVIKSLKKARKDILSLLTKEKLAECKAPDLGKLLAIVDDRIKITEGEGHAGSYERRITISGTAKSRSVQVSEIVSNSK